MLPDPNIIVQGTFKKSNRNNLSKYIIFRLIYTNPCAFSIISIRFYYKTNQRGGRSLKISCSYHTDSMLRHSEKQSQKPMVCLQAVVIALTIFPVKT